jgi:flap endonuclease-1
VTNDYALDYGELQEETLYRFLCEERDFSRERVKVVVDRMRKFYAYQRQVRLEKWFSKDS